MSRCPQYGLPSVVHATLIVSVDTLKPISAGSSLRHRSDEAHQANEAADDLQDVNHDTNWLTKCWEFEVALELADLSRAGLEGIIQLHI